MKNLKSFLQHYEWHIIGLLITVFTLLGYWGFWIVVQPKTWLGNVKLLYLTAQLFTLESNLNAEEGVIWQLVAAQCLVPLLVAYAAWKTFMLVFRQKVRLLLVSLWKGGHVVICGLGDKGRKLADEFLSSGEKVIAIDKKGCECERKSFEKNRGVFIEGDATEASMLRTAAAGRARCVICISGNSETNVDILKALEECAIHDTLRCYVHIVDPELQNILSESDLFKETGRIQARMFNLYETGARVLLHNYPPDRFVKIRSEKDDPPHILVCGFRQMGNSLVMEAAQLAHYANGRKLKISIVSEDGQGDGLIMRLCSRQPHLQEMLDIKAVPVAVDCLSTGDFQSIQSDLPLTAAYVCLEEDASCLSLARRIRRMLSKNTGIPIVACLSPKTHINSFINWEKENIHVFGLNDEVCTRKVIIDGDEQNDNLARIVHENYLKKVNKDPANAKFNDWEQLPKTYRDANRRAAGHMFVKLRALGYDVAPSRATGAIELTPNDINEQDAWRLAVMEKNRWNAERWLDGWEYNEKRDDSKKRHDLLVPWDRLPGSQQQKDVNNVLIIPELLKEAGLKVVRIT